MDKLTKISSSVKKYLDARTKLLMEINRSADEEHGSDISEAMEAVKDARSSFKEFYLDCVTANRLIKDLVKKTGYKD